MTPLILVAFATAQVNKKNVNSRRRWIPLGEVSGLLVLQVEYRITSGSKHSRF